MQLPLRYLPRMLSSAAPSLATRTFRYSPRSYTHIPTSARTASIALRNFQTSRRFLADTVPAPVRKPVGAFRGGLFGFLLGTALSGAGVYYYILEEYRVSNELLTEDIYALQAAVQSTETYVRGLEERIQETEKKQEK